jgi:hypothetical protein
MKTSLLALALLALLASSCAAERLPAPEIPRIKSQKIKEASGLAISSASDDFLWTLNDSGGSAHLHLFGTDGRDHGKTKVTNAENIDWEDLASFTLDGKNYLLVADVGDNDALRETCTLYFIPEPKLPADGKKLGAELTSTRHIEFRYEDGPRDCESVAVDVVDEKIILISKRSQPPEVYELPLRASAKRGVIVARKIGVTAVDSPVGSLIPFANQPTGLDISRDRSHAAVVTYYGVFLFPRQAGETWTQALARKPVSLGSHGLGQAESIAFSRDGKFIYTISEGKNSPIIRYRIP